MNLKRMKVQQVIPDNVSGLNMDGRRVYVHNLQNAVVVVPLGTQYE